MTCRSRLRIGMWSQNEFKPKTFQIQQSHSLELGLLAMTPSHL